MTYIRDLTVLLDWMRILMEWDMLKCNVFRGGLGVFILAYWRPPPAPSAAPSTRPHGTPHHPAQYPRHGSQHPPPRRLTPHPPPRPAYPPGVVAIFPHRKNSGGRWKNGTRPLCQPGLRLSACQWCNTLTRKSRQAPRPMISMYIPNEESTKIVHTVSKQQEPHEDGSPLAGLGAHISENPHSQPV